MEAIPKRIRDYFVEHIFGAGTHDRLPPNFRRLDSEVSGRWRVDGCPVPGQNLVHIEVLTAAGRIVDVRVPCERCDPFMFVAADLAANWARGRDVQAVLATDTRAAVRDVMAPLGRFFRSPREFTLRCERMVSGLRLALTTGRSTSPPAS